MTGVWFLVDICSKCNHGYRDKIYSKKACFIDDESNTSSIAGLDIDADFLSGLDPMYRLLLRTGHQAFSDGRIDQLDRERVGVIIGNLALPLRLKGHRDAFDIAADWLEKVGLKARARHRPHQMSGGEQQRVAVARAFVAAPRFIFADEPTGNLDIHTSESVAGLMFDFARESRCGLVIVTHSQALALRADKSLRLVAGRLEAAA